MINGVFPLYEHYDPPVEHLTMPVLNIQSSPALSDDSALRFVELPPKGELKTIPGLSHLCMWTKADKFNRLLAEFFNGLSRREERLIGYTGVSIPGCGTNGFKGRATIFAPPFFAE